MHISYDVTDSSAQGLDGFGLQFDGSAQAKGSGAMVTDTVSDGSNNHLAAASVFASGGGGSQLSNTASFNAAQTNLHVEEGIVLKSVGLAGAAATSAIDGQFTAMPEPGTLLLLASGMAGLFVMARKREH